MAYRRFLPLLALPAALLAQHGTVAAPNPLSSAADRAAGARLFRAQCSVCHGLDGSGSANGSDLTTGNFRHGTSDDALFRTISKGVPGTAMPPSPLDGRQVWQVVAYVRSLSVGRGAEKAKGDPAKGRRVLESSGCLKCHSVGGEGGYLGPDLNEVGSRLTLAQLQRAVLDPGGEVSPDYASLRARTKSGESITGVRLNEDTYSIQILDSGGRLRSLSKDDLASYELIRTSPMPSFKGKLQQAQVDDLVAYLATLRRETDTAQ